MKQYVLGAIIGIFSITTALRIHGVIQQTAPNSKSNVRGGKSVKSPDENWTAWIKDEFSPLEEKNYISFAIYGTNGDEQAFTRFECFGGTARGSTITWKFDGRSVTASIPMTTGYGRIRSRAEIEYNFPKDRLTTQRIVE